MILLDEIKLNELIEKGDVGFEFDESDILSEYCELPNKADDIWEQRDKYASVIY